MSRRFKIIYYRGMEVKELRIFLLGIVLICLMSFSSKIGDNPVYADSSNLVVTSCFDGDVANSTCLSAVTTDGGTDFSFSKNHHLDMAFQTLNTASISSATLYYDASGTLSGSWEVAITATRDGTSLCSADPAPENVAETRNSLSCTISSAQLNSGVWFYTRNNDGAGPESITLDYIYLAVEYTPAATVSISITTDGSVAFGIQDLNTTADTTSGDLNDIETVSVDTGPADLDIRSSTFTDGGNNWTYASSNGANQIKFEFSKDGTAWSTFLLADTLYVLDTNVAESATRDIYLRLTTPTSTTSYSQYSTTVTVVASVP